MKMDVKSLETVCFQVIELNIANKTLQLQNEKVEELYQAVTDSISSAYRIQNAIFPPKEILNNHLNDYFILLKPRDVVSGDFYWYKNHNDYLFVVAADCTGHGVPGAFMSILGMLLLDDIVLRLKELKPS